MSHFAGLTLLPAARNDLRDIWRYTVNTWNEAQAERYLGAIEHTCHQLMRQPLLGKTVSELDAPVRAYLCQQHVLFYLIEPEGVRFIAFLHARMDMLQQLGARIG